MPAVPAVSIPTCPRRAQIRATPAHRMDPDLPDAALLERARRGDDAAFRALVVRHEPVVAATVIGMLGRGADADDVGQETFVRLYRSLDRFRGEASLKTYLVRIAINLSLNALRARRRARHRFVSRDDAGAPLAEPAVAPAEPGGEAELRAAVHAAVGRLGPKHRPVVVLRMLEGMSTRETAQALGVPEGTVLSRLSRALRELRTHLAPYVRGTLEDR
jgi:RNA polymerase sigma-70 factor, ECF subfamily